MSEGIGIQEIVNNGYCIGCGVCAAVKHSPYSIQMDQEGKYQANLDSDKTDNESIARVCPFANEALNEDEIGKKLFGEHRGIHHDAYLGYHLKNFAGGVSEDTYREKGSSGGFGSWFAVTLLEEHLVDYVIHVRPINHSSSILFAYTISTTKEEVREGAKSKYYPIELSNVLDVVRNTPGRYLLIGIPCFIKAVRLLAEQEPIFKERIVFTMGLVCGHLKTDRFAKTIGWELGIHPDAIESIDFRVKIPETKANSYGVAVKGNGVEKEITSPMKDILVHNWGHGLFRYNACDYCDDVLAETSDITIGDAWLPEYVKDGRGTNIIVVRNPVILSLLEKHCNKLAIEEISAEKIYTSQAGGFRHRREGLSYRLYLKDLKKEWRPNKRVKPSNQMSTRRKRIYEHRIPLASKANEAYQDALSANDFSIFKNNIEPELHRYNKLYHRPLLVRVVIRLLRYLRNMVDVRK
ncbi:MAG: coenzyme F420 hydrogenase [Tissierellia bacterium]|nr:coenzyme F420 hydrogenase [Tissierellia bacterium]